MTDRIALQAAVGHTFNDSQLLCEALTHRSYSNERGEDANYERLEFLGDSVLGLVTAEWLFERYPDQPEGELARLKSFLVSAQALRRHAEALGIGEELRLGVGESRSGGREKASILADAMEAIFGAVYLDAGLDAARRVIRPLLEAADRERASFAPADAKTRLQEQVQAFGWALPCYRVAEEAGPDHRKTFTVECWIEDRLMGTASGRSKKVAERGAAMAAIAQLDPGED